jgi:hypothetical protein
MNYYQKLERPVANESEAVNLKFGLTLQQIMDVVRDITVIFFCRSFSQIGKFLDLKTKERYNSKIN